MSILTVCITSIQTISDSVLEIAYSASAVNDMGVVGFEGCDQFPILSTGSQMNSAIIDHAINLVATNGVTIAPQDRKMMFGGMA